MDLLDGLFRADAVLVGGGLTGMMLAAALSESGMRVAVVDDAEGSSEPGSCVASMLCAPLLARAEHAYGADTARRYAACLQTQLHALLAASLPYVRPIAGYAYASRDKLPELEKQHALLLSLQVPVRIAEDAGGCPFPVELSLTAKAALINTAIWREALSAVIRRRGGRIYRNCRVMALREGQVLTPKGCVEAPYVVLTTGKPLGLSAKPLLALLESRRLAWCMLTGSTPLHSSQQSAGGDGLAFHPTPEGIAAVWDAGRLGAPAQQERLRTFDRTLHRLLPDWTCSEIRYAQAVHPLDGLPIIGPLPGSQALCIAGTDGYGVLGAMHAAEVMARRILGHALPEDAMFLPDRELSMAVLRPHMQRCTRIYLRSMLRRRAPVCSHCGCRMRYSIAAQCWECPFCGTCYTMLGQRLCGPGVRNAAVSVRQRPDL